MTDEQILNLWIIGRDCEDCTDSNIDDMIKTINMSNLHWRDWFGQCKNERAVIVRFHDRPSPYVAILALPFSKNIGNVLYVVEDPWCFAPTKQQFMMLFAKLWYSKNKEQFE